MATTQSRLTGYDAITYAECHGLTLSKYNDPLEEAREGLTVAEARQVAREDMSLIYLDVLDMAPYAIVTAQGIIVSLHTDPVPAGQGWGFDRELVELRRPHVIGDSIEWDAHGRETSPTVAEIE